MALTDIEQRFLAGHRHGRLATVAPGGAPQVKPVGFAYNGGLGTIDIGGFNMADSAKYRNVARNPDVAFVVDDVVGEGIEGVHFLEIRGVAEALTGPDIIRIHPRRVVGFSGGFAAIDPAGAGGRGISVQGTEQVRFGPGEHERFAARALAEIAAGRIAPVIGQTFPLDRAPDARGSGRARGSGGAHRRRQDSAHRALTWPSPLAAGTRRGRERYRRSVS